MKPTIDILEEKISKAITDALQSEHPYPAIVRPSANSDFGDYQANGIMGAAKRNKLNPRELALNVVQRLDISDIAHEPEVAGPGFINIRLKEEYLCNSLLQIASDPDRLGVDKTDSPQTIVVDYSGPNIAKEMHVGHLRSTIIGDCICEMLSFLGHNVIRQNHIGDWGTQFGMLCALLAKKIDESNGQAKLSMELSDLEAFYKEAKQLYDNDPAFAKKARNAIAGLHSGDQTWKKHWECIVSESRKHYTQIYQKLGVNLTQADEYGESAYRNDLQNVVDDFKQAGIAVESDNAICVFPEGFKTKEGQPLPFIIQKSDGAFLYATTDLAAMRYRINKLNADKVIYVTDARQMLHFEMLFAVAKLAGITKENTQLVHVTFGTMLGDDGKPFKTRSGENVKLKDLLDEAVDKARAIVEEKNPDFDESTKAKIAQAVGIGAVKYSDFSNNRTTDYVFSFDKMLAMEGNTAPYMQYACARVKSIERKALPKGIDIENEIVNIKKISLNEAPEIELAKFLLKYIEAIKGATEDYRPNFITNYLYELAQKFSNFYTNCPVLSADDNTRPSRLLLCMLTEKTIMHGLKTILRIDVPDQM